MVNINKLKKYDYLKIYIKEFCLRYRYLSEDAILNIVNNQFANFELHLNEKEKNKIVNN